MVIAGLVTEIPAAQQVDTRLVARRSSEVRPGMYRVNNYRKGDSLLAGFESKACGAGSNPAPLSKLRSLKRVGASLRLAKVPAEATQRTKARARTSAV